MLLHYTCMYVSTCNIHTYTYTCTCMYLRIEGYNMVLYRVIFSLFILISVHVHGIVIAAGLTLQWPSSNWNC